MTRSEYDANESLALSTQRFAPRDVISGNRFHERIERFAVINCGGYENDSLRVIEYEVIGEDR